MGNPLLLEDVLIRHHNLRLYVMHFGSPFVDDTIALLYSYPQVYVDVTQNDWGFPRKHFPAQLRRLVEAGFGKRILFGSGQMIWPETIGLAIETIKSADFLTDEQKRTFFTTTRCISYGQTRRVALKNNPLDGAPAPTHVGQEFAFIPDVVANKGS